jgi:ring-1,2-phenylacetyl-CoA epoxidase subunit PaaE
MPGSLFIKLKIVQIRQETADTKSFVLERVGGPELKYQAGQFLTFVFYHYNGEEVRRSYSISSSYELNEPLTITVKRVPNGEFSRWFFDKTIVGDLLITTGVSGFFTLPQPEKDIKQFVFIAAGSGITPVYALIKTLLYQYPSVTVLLIYSNKSPATTIFYQQLRFIQEKFPGNFRIEFLFSSSPDLLRARLSFSLLEALLNKHITTSAEKKLFYLCGPHGYMQKATIELRRQGVQPADIRKENFVTFMPVLRNELNNHRYQFVVQYPVSILAEAKKQGIEMPYSCESGKCGSCAATCVSGKVWMRYNEVLLEDEIKKGRVLTCTGFPVDGDVIVEF